MLGASESIFYSVRVFSDKRRRRFFPGTADTSSVSVGGCSHFYRRVLTPVPTEAIEHDQELKRDMEGGRARYDKRCSPNEKKKKKGMEVDLAAIYLRNV